jgi:hypothetical protein
MTCEYLIANTAIYSAIGDHAGHAGDIALLVVALHCLTADRAGGGGVFRAAGGVVAHGAGVIALSLLPCLIACWSACRRNKRCGGITRDDRGDCAGGIAGIAGVLSCLLAGDYALLVLPVVNVQRCRCCLG